MKCIGLLIGNQFHHIDHIAPLCQLLNIPLCYTEPTLTPTIQRFYPNLNAVHHIDPGTLLNQYEGVISCLTSDLLTSLLFQINPTLPPPQITIFCHHGNSEKNYTHEAAQHLLKENIILSYGPKFLDYMAKANALEGNLITIHTGNYRFDAYKTNQPFYDSLAYSDIFSKLPQNCPNILYAPTWQREEKGSILLGHLEQIIPNIPPQTNLIIKLHPNTIQRFSVELEVFADIHAKNPHLLFLNAFPTIYPLLAQVDLFIGDNSSVIYDFLTFNRPILSFDPNCTFATTTHLKTLLQDIDHALINKLPATFTTRQAAYTYAFGSPQSGSEIAHQLTKALSMELALEN